MSISVHIKKKLKDFTLSVDLEGEGERIGLLGSSGCGKSMTLKCIAGIETPDEGRICIGDRVLYDSEQKIDLPAGKRKVGYLFQNYALFPHMTALENVKAGLGGSGREREERAGQLLKQFRIEELSGVYPNRMSGGQQQRVALARMLAAEPEVLLLDEPFSALDAFLKEKLMQEMLAFLGSFGKDVVMVSHSRDEIYQMCDSMAVMNRGQIEVFGKTKEIFARPRTLEAARLTGCKNISAAERRGDRRVYARDWDVLLETAEPVGDEIRYVGIRAHDFAVSAAGNRRGGAIPAGNRMACVLERISEAPFEMYLILRNGEAAAAEPVWWKVSKEEWERMGGQTPEALYFPPEQIILLKQG